MSALCFLFSVYFRNDDAKETMIEIFSYPCDDEKPISLSIKINGRKYNLTNVKLINPQTKTRKQNRRVI